MYNLKQIYKTQQFDPNLISLLINPFYFIRMRLYKSIKAQATKVSGKLLDFGCGAKPYKKLFQVSDYIGLEYSGEGHDHKTEQIDVFYDGHTIPFTNEHFDTVFSSEVFEHLFNLDEILTEIHRVLKPNGHLLFTIPFTWHEHEEPIDFARYTSFGIQNILKKRGFKIIDQKKTGHFAEAVWQLWIAYLYQLIETKNKFFNILLTTVFIFPFNLIGALFLWLFPKNYKYYHNNVILAIKI